MHIEFNTKDKTVIIIEMEAKDLPRITEFINQVCGNSEGWKVISRVSFQTITTSPKTFDWKDWTNLEPYRITYST